MIFIPLVGAAVTYILGQYYGKSVRYFPLLISIIILALAIYSYAFMYVNNAGGEFIFVEGPYQWLSALKGVDYYLGIDGLSAPLVLVSAFLTVLVIMGSRDLISTNLPSYYALVLLFEGAIIGVFTSLNLILFYVFWEIVLIPMFFFIGVWGGPRRKYASMKFLIYTFFGGVVMLLGFLVIYLFSNLVSPTFNIPELYGKIPAIIQLFVSAATLIGFGIKLPIFPFHTWLPDAHVEAPAPISVFLAGLLLKMGGYGLIRINIGLLPEASLQLRELYIVLGIITIFYGAVVALTQKDLKKMIAFTSINHMGFVMLGAFTGNLFGYAGAVFQMFNHACTIGLLFMLSGYIHEQAGTRDIDILKGLKFRMSRTSTLLVLGSFAAMGVPIYSTFLSEYMVIVGAISLNTSYAIVMLIPAITSAYFLWMIRRAVLSKPQEGFKVHDSSLSSSITLFIYLIPLFLLLIFPFLMLDIINAQAAPFIGG
jgi:NADH-quinone oxidoreductase subunit M